MVIAKAPYKLQRIYSRCALWDLFDIHGSIRVVATIAEELQLVSQNCLPLPVLGLEAYQRERVLAVIEHLGIS